MIASLTILVLSAAMLLLWRRYISLLLRCRDHVVHAIRERRFRRRELRAGCACARLDEILERDSAICDRCLNVALPRYGFEEFLMLIDFEIMQIWSSIANSRWASARLH